MTGKKITKTELVDRVYEKTGIVRKDIKTALDLTLEGIKEALADGTVIELRGFGTFEVRRRKGRQKARNPKTGEYVSVTSHGIAAFRPGREMKQAVWNVASEDAENAPPSDTPDRPVK
jgi:integration host factor subunit beta